MVMLYPILAQTPPIMDAWGSVTDLGAELIEGEGHIYGKMLFGAPDSALSCAYFGVTKGEFRMVYPFNEHAVVVEGDATLTDLNTGIAQRFGIGDAWFVEKGTPVSWEVHSDRFVKNYSASA